MQQQQRQRENLKRFQEERMIFGLAAEVHQQVGYQETAKYLRNTGRKYLSTHFMRPV